MGHYWGAPNRSIGGNCGRWLVNYTVAPIIDGLCILFCMAQLLPPTACPCLGMVVDQMTDEAIKEGVSELISRGREDLRSSGTIAA